MLLTAEQMELEIEQDIKVLLKKSSKYLKKNGVKVGDTAYDKSTRNNSTWYVSIATDGGEGTEEVFHRFSSSMNRLSIVKTYHLEGTYFWDADTYIRPCIGAILTSEIVLS